MSKDGDEELPDDDDTEESIDEVDVRDYLRAALKPPPDRPDAIIKGVHKKIREETEFKEFFTDGWSTSRAPKETYLITSIIMLVVVVLAWLLLGPYGL